MNKRGRLRDYLEARRPAAVDEPEWRELLGLLAPISTHSLRKLLRESGWPLAPLVEGVRQDSFEALDRTLLSLAMEYEQGGRERRRLCRDAVITAKTHARWAARKEERRLEKEEMILRMLTWLENPGVFAAWLALRERTLHKGE